MKIIERATIYTFQRHDWKNVLLCRTKFRILLVMDSKSKKLKKYELTEDSYWVASEAPSVYARTFFDLVDISDLNKKLIDEEFMNINIKTIKRYLKDNKPLSAMGGELVLKLIGLYRKGLEVFSTTDHFNTWLSKPAFGMGGAIPIHFLKTSTGIDLVKEELMRMEYGATA